METVSTYSEARNEYLKQLCTWVTPYMIQFYRGIWANALRTGGNQRVMVVFQERCAEVPKWNQDTIDQHVGALLDSCRCDYLEELMSAVFIAHTKVLIAVRISGRQKKLQITLPKLDHFLHRIFSECARSFWKSPFLFLEDAKPIEMQKNLLQAEALCNEAIASAVRSLLPIKNILNEYLSEDQGEEVESVSGGRIAAAEPVPLASEPVPVASEPVPVASEPVPVASEPVPVASEPVSVEPVVTEVANTTAMTEPVSAEPELATESVTVEPMTSDSSNPPPEEIVIDAEPGVHFNNYDNVFDENTGAAGTFEYVPKNIDTTPHLEIREGPEIPLSEDSSIMQLDAPGNENVDIDETLD